MADVLTKAIHAYLMADGFMIVYKLYSMLKGNFLCYITACMQVPIFIEL